MAKVTPVDMEGDPGGKGPPPVPPKTDGPPGDKQPPRRGGGGCFTFILAAAALGLGGYLAYDMLVVKRVIEDLPDPAGLLDEYVDRSLDDSVLGQVGALEDRISRVEGKVSRMEEIIERLGQEIGSSQGISEHRSSIPLHQLRIVLADVRLRATGDPGLVIDELRTVLPFIPDQEGALRRVLEADIEALSALPSRDELLRKIGELEETLASPLETGEQEVKAEGVVGFLYGLADVKRAPLAEEANLLSARAGARNARTLALVGDAENYAAQIESVRQDVDTFAPLYPEGALARLRDLLDELSGLGLPSYGLAAASTAWSAVP